MNVQRIDYVMLFMNTPQPMLQEIQDNEIIKESIDIWEQLVDSSGEEIHTWYLIIRWKFAHDIDLVPLSTGIGLLSLYKY